MSVRITFRKLTKRTAFRIVGGLLLANMLAYLATDSYVNMQQSKMSADKNTNESNLIEAGWQVMHWSYSLLEYFRHTNPVENR